MKVGDEFNPWRMFVGAWIPNWLLQRTDVNPVAKLVYARFCQYGGEDGEVYPKVGTLAAEIGCSERGVRKAIEELEELRLIRVEDRRGSRQSSVYKFIFHEWIVDALRIKQRPEKDKEPRPEQSAGRSKLTTGTEYRSRPEQSAGLRPEQSAALLRESGEESQVGRESGLSEPPPALAEPAHPDSPQGAHASPPAPLQEEKKASAAEGCEKLNPPPAATGFDVSAWQEEQRAKARARAEQAIREGETKNTEARRKKLAKANAKERWKAAVEDELPPDEPERTPRGQLEHVWKAEWVRAFPDLPPARKWGGKEYGQAQLLLDRYELISVQTALEYVIRNWEKLKARWFKKDISRGGIAPSLGLILRMHDTVVPEASVWEKHRDVVQEYEDFGDRYEERPAELQARYFEAQKELQALGL